MSGITVLGAICYAAACLTLIFGWPREIAIVLFAEAATLGLYAWRSGRPI